MKKILFIVLLTSVFLHANSFDVGMKYFIKGKYSKALPHFVKSSNAGNKKAQFHLANMYEMGLGVKKDEKMASKLYKLYTSKSKVKTKIKAKALKKKIVRKKVVKKSAPKRIVVKKSTKGKAYSKRLKKFYNPELQGATEITFD